jgi:hypothetical protein
MTTKRPAFVKGTSPKFTLKYPKLTEPDYGSKDYPKPNGEYSTKAVMQADSPEAKAFIKLLTPHYRAAIEQAETEFKALKVEQRKKLGSVTENDLFTTLYDQETEEPTGEIEFKFAMTASGELKKGPKAGQRWNRKPDLFDAKGQPMRTVPDIWGGTIGRVSFEMRPYFIPGSGAAGLKLALVGVQIIDLVSGGSRSADSHGFGEEEGGYEHTDAPVQSDTSEDDTSEDEGANHADGNTDF